MHVDVDGPRDRVAGGIVYLNTKAIVAEESRCRSIDECAIGTEADQGAAAGIGGHRKRERIAGGIGCRHLALQIRIQLGRERGCPQYGGCIRSATGTSSAATA